MVAIKSADRGDEPRVQKLSPADERLMIDKLGDPIWRICNLYSIVDKNGERVQFKPNEQQQKVLVDLFVHGYRRQVILKARQLGMSTLIEIILLDQALFNNNTQCSIVADTADNAKLLLENKVKFAYDELIGDYKRGAGKLSYNKTRITLQNGSSVNAGTRQRSGTNQVLHVSEWGKVAHKDPERSKEIRTGALNTVPRNGICLIESTFEGGKGGEFYYLLKRAMETKLEDMTDLDFLFQFFPWYEDPSYSLTGNYDQIDKESHEYFNRLEKEEDVYLTLGQKLWYYKMREIQGDEMKREYPTTAQEAFEVAVHGAIYGPTISKIRANKQIIDFTYDPSYPVNAYWDKGVGDYCSIWFIQIIGPWIYVIDHFRYHGKGAEFYAKIIKDKPYLVAMNYLPHDAKQRSPNDGDSFETALNKAGLENTHILPRTGDVWVGINQLVQLMPKMYFHKTNCAVDSTENGVEIPSGITCLENYHRLWIDDKNQWYKEPVHDWSSHDCDALRTFAEAYLLGQIGMNTIVGEEHKNKRLSSGRAISPYGSKRKSRKGKRK